MGEAEATYRLLPNLHLKDSNLAAKFVPTGFPEKRSKMLFKLHEDNEFMAFGREQIQVTGKDGFYVEKANIVDKYERRPVQYEDGTEHPLKYLCLAQFVREYEPCNIKNKSKKQKDENNSSGESESEEFEDKYNNYDENRYIKTCFDDEGENKKCLPKFIKLTSAYPGEPKYMKLRTHPLALRYCKYKKGDHEYFYSKLVQYRPFTIESNSISEGGLLECKLDFETCLNEFERRSNEMEPIERNSDENSATVSDENGPTDIEIVQSPSLS